MPETDHSTLIDLASPHHCDQFFGLQSNWRKHLWEFLSKCRLCSCADYRRCICTANSCLQSLSFDDFSRDNMWNSRALSGLFLKFFAKLAVSLQERCVYACSLKVVLFIKTTRRLHRQVHTYGPSLIWKNGMYAAGDLQTGKRPVECFAKRERSTGCTRQPLKTSCCVLEAWDRHCESGGRCSDSWKDRPNTPIPHALESLGPYSAAVHIRQPVFCLATSSICSISLLAPMEREKQKQQFQCLPFCSSEK